MYQRILVPTDGSSVAEAAVDHAIELARAWGGEIVAMCVVVPETVLPSIEGAMAYDPGLRIEELLEHARGYVDRVAVRAQQAGVHCTTATSSALDASKAIVDMARQQHCDLIVMGSHGRRGLSRLLAGSVTQAVLASAPVPVMVLRLVAGHAGVSPAAGRASHAPAASGHS